MSEQETTADSAADDRSAWLRKSVAEGQSGAARSAWSWIVELSTLADNDADSAEAQLGELFRLGYATARSGRPGPPGDGHRLRQCLRTPR